MLPAAKCCVFDISWVDQEKPHLLSADRSNAAVDIVDARTNTLLFQLTGGFKGLPETTAPPVPTALPPEALPVRDRCTEPRRVVRHHDLPADPG